MKILVKLGGTLLDAEESRHRLARDITNLQQLGNEVVVVHGGGKQMTRFLAERGVESKFVNGLRVTSPEVVDAVLKVFAGSVNKQLVSAFVQAGARAVGLSGIDDCLTEAEQMDPALGAVGRPVRSNPELMNLLTANGFLPVIACVAGDRQGRIYNVNADQMAVACASAFGAERLFFLTDVDGVRGPEGSILPVVTVSEAKALTGGGVATGGMEAKLNAAAAALSDGVGEVVIAPGGMPDVLTQLAAGMPVGTRMLFAREGTRP